MFSRASITMSNATKFCWGLGSFSKMVEGASKALRANSLTWSKISNGLMNNEVYPVNILNIQQRKNKPKRLELFSQMSKKCLQLHTFFFTDKISVSKDCKENQLTFYSITTMINKFDIKKMCICLIRLLVAK